jgi:hypothetical protein
MRRIVLFLLVFVAEIAVAGGPLNVAGVSWFQPGLSGTPITWANGKVSYYTDQGDLSPLLPNADANQFVADAFSRWTSVSTAAIQAERAGELAEDVNGDNVTLVNAALSLPEDIQPTSSKALAVVYDADGRVFDALLGAGAGAADMCSTNSIYGETNRFTEDAHAAHALVIINGNCAQTSTQLAILKYRLVRVLGRVFGLDYSQLNDNVVFGTPPPGLDDYAGFPVMHPLAVLCSEANCLSHADELRMDDRAAISRLYPVTAENLSSFVGKTVFRENTGRIYGSVRFLSASGLGQGMQGVNVVARMVDPVTNRVSRQYAASSVSGFLFRGNAGNAISGYYSVVGRRFDAMGSSDPALEGYFDLSGLEIPDGYSSVTYELSVEPVNPLYADSTSVGPYHDPVTPSGSSPAIRLTVTRGGEVLQDIVMQGDASDPQDQFEPNDFNLPASLPGGGSWLGSLSGYGDEDYFSFSAQANRTFTFDVTALDANGVPTSTKAMPVLGAWAFDDPKDVSRIWESYFNSPFTGTTRLQGEILSAGNYKLGIVDFRGDGRPDYRYRARLLYGDNVSPSRSSVLGGNAITISGVGFSSAMQVVVGSTLVPATTTGSTQIMFRAPALQDGMYDVMLTDPATGATSLMEHVLSVGSVDARLLLLGGSNPQIPVGTQAPNAFRVQVVDAFTGAPVEGATVNFSVPPTAAIVGCAQSTCTQYSDQNGIASVYLIVKAVGPSVIQASLPTGGSTAVTINGVAATFEIALDHPNFYVAAGANATLSVSATVVVNGTPAANQTVNFLVNSGSATFDPASPVTNSNGIASTLVSVGQVTSDVNISACVAPGDSPCRTLMVYPVTSNNIKLQTVGGDQQTIGVGQNFAPVSLKVTDVNANPVSSVAVAFLVDVYRAQTEAIRVVNGEAVTFRRAEPVMLQTFTATVVSDGNGLVTLPIAVNETQPVNIIVQVRAGNAEQQLALQSVWTLNSDTPPPSGSRSSTLEVQGTAAGITRKESRQVRKRSKRPKGILFLE